MLKPPTGNSLLQLDAAGKVFTSGFLRKSSKRALEPVSFNINESPPTITAIAGESGSGKTTLARLLLGLVKPTEGKVLYRGLNLASMSREALKQFRHEVQVIFQDPFEAYNPFYKIEHVLKTPIRKFHLASDKTDARRTIDMSLETVGLRPDETWGRYPHQLSGGQRQRVMVARAAMLKPKIIVADEPVSMVDASLRATILESLRTLKSELKVSIVYITHDLTTAYQLADNIIVLYRGRVVEAGDVESVINHPEHPYTRLLVDCIPKFDTSEQWEGEALGEYIEPPSDWLGCNFYDRCPVRMYGCKDKEPPFFHTSPRHVTSCYVYDSTAQARTTLNLSATFVASLTDSENRVASMESEQ